MGEFIDVQAEIGISKHQGGLPATRQLLGLCHVERAHEVLDVGCGTGVGPAYIARTRGCAGGCALRDPTTRASGIME